MRIVVLLLVIANLTLFAYTRLDAASRGEASRLERQVQPDKIKLLTPPQVAALGPAKVAALADRRSSELRTQGINDVSTVDIGRGQYAVSLGMFRTEVAAYARADVGSDVRVGACPTSS